MRALVFLVLTAWLLSSACVLVPPTPPAAQAPLEVEVHLAQADRELIERFLAQSLALSGSAAASPLASAVHEARDTPCARGAASQPEALKPEALKKERMRLEQGPILRASHDSGAPLYEGVQVRTGERWQRNGPWRAWYDEGQTWEEGAYLNGEEHGPWLWWYENGEPQASGTFDQGAHVGRWVFHHENGQVMAEGEYEADRPNGRWRTFHANGALRSEGEYMDGLRTGRWTFQDESGALDALHSGLYAAGEWIGG